MGWNSWCTDSLCNLFGADPCSEHMVKSTADAMVSQGLRDLGYTYVALDDCWSAKTRDGAGRLQHDAARFPNGMQHVADYVHSKGLLFGLYTSVGDKTCKGDRPGSLGHYARDAATLTGWGVDMIKMDHCGLAGNNDTDRALYGNMSRALNATGRPVLFSMCNWGEAQVWEWGADVAQMYRIQMDHLPFWKFSGANKSAGVGLGQGTYDIIEWMAELVPSKWTKRFGWMDPDFLMTRYLTMDFTASRTEYTFWALWSAPLLVSTDVRKMSKDKSTILKNKEVIAINQDALATAGDRVFVGPGSGGAVQVWARDLANGDKCVVLYNSGATKAAGPSTRGGNVFADGDADNGGSDGDALGGGSGGSGSGGADMVVGVTWEMLGWNGSGVRVQVRDLWAQATLGNFTRGYNATLKARDVQMLRVKKL